MKCELCHVNEACIEVKQIADGTVREAHLCGECAAQKGFKSPEDLAGLLIGGGLFPFGTGAGGDGAREADAGESALSCPGCHMRAADYRKTSRLGCGRCYETFAALLEPVIVSMQRSVGHKGKHPVREDVREELNGLKTRMEGAIRKEAYEEAASLRDRIRVLELAKTCLEPAVPPPVDGPGDRD